jgi:hypothetical protein
LKPFLARLLALLLLVQSGMAGAHCLRGMAAGDGLLVEICSIEGKRLVVLGPGGEPMDSPAPASERGFCPVCHGLPQVALPAPAVTLLEPLGVATIHWHAKGEALRLPPARAPPYTTRAPPAQA